MTFHLFRSKRARIFFLLLPVLLLPTALSCRREVGREDTARTWQYTALDEKTRPAFNLCFKLNPDESAAFRLLFGDVEEGTGRYLEFDARGIHAGIVRDNVEFDREMLSRVALSELSGTKITLEGRRHRWSLIADGRLLAAGDDIIKPTQPVSFGVKGGHVKVTGLRFQPSPDIYFTDAFMRTQEDPSSWREVLGTWKVNVKSDPILSANAFSYAGAGSPEAGAIVGEDSWNDMEVSVACRPSGSEGVGIYLYYRGPDDYVLFRWSGQSGESPGKQVIRRKGDTERVLAEAPGGYAAGQWHTLGALAGCGWARFRLDDTEVFSVRDPEFTHGKVGLYVRGEAPALFDDFRVETQPASWVDFDRYRLDKWLVAGGDWKQIAATRADPDLWSGGVVVCAVEPARLLWGRPQWQDYRVETRVMPWETGVLGLCFGYQDNEDYYSVRWKKAGGSVLELWHTDAGEQHLLNHVPVAKDLKAHALSVATRRNEITVRVDDVPVLRAMDSSSVRGRAGLYAEDVTAGLFSGLSYAALPDERPVANIHRTFSAEKSMDTWANALSDWTRSPIDEGEGNVRDVWWHRSDFHGDVRVDLRLEAPLPAGGEVGLVVSGDVEDSNRQVFARLFRAEENEEASSELTAELYRDGVLHESATTSWQEGPRVLGLKRVGSRVALCLGDETLLMCDINPDAPERRVGWWTRNVDLTTDDVDIYSENFINDTFVSAPAGWRVGSGTWEVTNKWQCDPRWSFFSGRSDDVAVLWSKRPLSGDFEIEYYIGNKMDQKRGNNYEYAQDMNITVCADGRDLTSGYSFVFGGFDNTVTAIYRQKKQMVDAPAAGLTRINRSSWLHRNWYHFSVSRKGSLLEMRVNGEVIMSKEDDKPLDGGHWALWTRNNGIMLARVRVTAESIEPRDAPDTVWPQEIQSIYDIERY